MVTLGVEEELFLVGSETGALADAVELLLPAGDTERVKRELFACIVEVTTPVSTSLPDVRAWLGRERERLAAEGERHGLRLVACGAHPLAREPQPRVTDTPRYRRIARLLGPSLPAQVICGLHVHVGFATRAHTWNALEGVIPWLPSLLALSVNSPYAEGIESPLRSVRAERLAMISRTPLPPEGAGPGDQLEQDGADWWDIRVNRRYGTLEMRVADQSTSVERSVALTALAQALAVAAGARTNAPADRAAYAEARSEALRGRHSAVDLARHVEPHATSLGTWALIAGLLDAQSEAERQLEVGRARGLDAVVRDLADRTVG